MTATATRSPSTSIAPPLPHSAEAERSVLGAILLSAGHNAIKAITAILQPGDFFLDQHRRAYCGMLALFDRGDAIDLVTLAQELGRLGELDAAGGSAYLAQLIDGVPRVTHVEHYARIVKEASVRREIIHFSEALQQRAFDEAEEIGAIISRAEGRFSEMRQAGLSDWRQIFDSAEELQSAPPLRFALADLIQTDGATMIGGPSGHGKTLLMLSIAKALLAGPGCKLWGRFEVQDRAERVVYLIPESTRGPFAYRLNLFRLMPYVADGRLLVRTLSKGRTLPLSDPRVLEAAAGAHVFLDTAIRFTDGDENAAGDNQRGLANDIFGLLGAGARTVVAAHHSPKSFLKERVMTLENMLRGTGDIGAMLATAWGLRHIDEERNVIHVENLKARDFKPCGPFELEGRPWIDQEGDFRMYRDPGLCGRLDKELEPEKNAGGASQSAREARAANIELLRGWLRDEPNLSSQVASHRYAQLGIKVGDSAIRKYRKELGL